MKLYLVVFQLAAEDSTMPELVLHGYTSRISKELYYWLGHNAACDVQDVVTVS